jgi:hypothetical protein
MPRHSLLGRIYRAHNQTEAVHHIMRHLKKATPSQVHSVALDAGMRCPLTSIRRSLTVLTEDNRLTKTDALRVSPLGASEHIWSIQ